MEKHWHFSIEFTHIYSHITLAYNTNLNLLLKETYNKAKNILRKIYDSI